MSAELLGITINYQTAPLEVRERLRLSEERSAALRALLTRISTEHLVLSTCERLEVYAVVDNGSKKETLSAILDFLHDGAFGGCNPFRVDTKSAALPRVVPAAPIQPWAGGCNAVGVEPQINPLNGDEDKSCSYAHGVLEGRSECSPGLQSGEQVAYQRLVPEGRLIRPLVELELRSSQSHSKSSIAPNVTQFVRTLRGNEVARQILGVAAGLESRIVGEPHVLGQVRQAYLTGLKQKTLGPILAALGRAAIHAGKRVRHETSINPTARSIVTVTVDALRKALGGLSQRNILIIGSGRLAGDLASVLAYRDASLRFASRSRARAESLAVRHQAPAGALDELPRMLGDAHAVIACSSATDYVVTRDTWDAARRGGAVMDLVVLDLSVPRNVDPTLHKCHGVSLMHLDELLCWEQVQREGVAAGTHIVHAEADRFEQWRRERALAPRIAELSRNAAAHRMGGKSGAKRLHRRIMDLKVEAAA